MRYKDVAGSERVFQFTSDTVLKSDSVEQFRFYLVQEEIDIKLGRALRSRIYNNGVTKV